MRAALSAAGRAQVKMIIMVALMTLITIFIDDITVTKLIDPTVPASLALSLIAY